MTDYIDAASRLWAAEKRKELLESEIFDLQDEVLSAGMRAVEPYRNKDKSEDWDPLTHVVDMLKRHHWESWGRQMPDGLLPHDIEHGTHLSREQVAEGIRLLGDMCARGYSYTLRRKNGRYTLIREGDE